MATRDHRIAEFISDQEPSEGTPVELLCEDHNGTYVLPYPCSRTGGEWHNIKTGEILQAQVLGWRKW